MPDPQIIVECMGGPFDGEIRPFRDTPPHVLLFQRRPRWAMGVRQAMTDTFSREYERYEIDLGYTGPRLRYHYMGKDRVEVKT